MNFRYAREPFVNLWLDPEQVREIDQPSLVHPINAKEWLSMTPSERRGLVGRLESQILYGEPVQVLEEKNGWCHVCVPDQLSPKHSLGYPGWVPSCQLTFDIQYHHNWKQNTLVQVIANRSILTMDSGRKLTISFMTKLPIMDDCEQEVVVLSPDGQTGRLPKSDITFVRRQKASPEYRIRMAKKFLGLSYLWGGTSSFGFDCSGMMYRIFEAGEIQIPRDASVQAQYGKPVEREKLTPGDLVFFAYDEGKGSIHHVGMYIGEHSFIHSPQTGQPVRINLLSDEPYHSEFCKGTRYDDE
ncbi:NlpC/P60 family protein [Melghirimyces algeriensis]|uniref:NlpC/P60 family protein n=1 Tax=Melghirimyces algeriensis TaxID=910412 RepID=A0A521BRF0_9BACL|nr:NlpC/P60 family protein [Melghirimyces algeriensis]SMO49734.1 NlpC/P60 family protein [Melghirimyces algeriensis]